MVLCASTTGNENILIVDITGCSSEGLSEDQYMETSTMGNVLHWSGTVYG